MAFDQLSQNFILIFVALTRKALLGFNSLSSGKCNCDHKLGIFQFIFCEIGLTWIPQDLADDKSMLVQVLAWKQQVAYQIDYNLI